MSSTKDLVTLRRVSSLPKTLIERMKDDSISSEKIILPLIRVAVTESVNLGSLSESSMRLDSWKEHLFDSMIYQLSTYLVGNKVNVRVCENISYPSDWKESFKERWFPEFLKKRYPVRYTHKPTLIHHYHTCPHVDSPWNGGEHTTFLTTFDSDYDVSENTVNVHKLANKEVEE